jgi:hypothetical protein
LTATTTMKFSVLFTTLLALFFHSSEAAIQMQRRNMPGGYSLAQVDSPQVVMAASFAVSSLSESPYLFASNVSAEAGYVVKVAKAWQQVVAGMNFRLVIIIENATGECIGSFTATVYDRFGEFSVTKWGKEVECAQAKALLETQGSSFEDDDFNE